MRFTRTTLVAAVTAAIVTTLTAAPAQAGAEQPDAQAAAALVRSLGDAHTAGAYFDQAAGRMVVTVTDSATAARVRDAGAVPRLVPRGNRELAEVMRRLDTGVTGTAWSVDPVTAQVRVQVDPTVTGDDLDRLARAVADSGGAARLEHLPSRLSPTISGGDAIYGGGYRCSLGFNVRKGDTYYFLTAGHCTNLVSQWYADGNLNTKLGDRTGSSFPGNDYGIVRYTNSSVTVSGTVGSQDITGAGDPVVGQSVTRRGSTTGTRSGTVTALNVTVRYAEGAVRGMIQTTVCAEPGDSGGPLYAGGTALGLTSGGSGDCRTGGTTFFQPVTEALSKYGVSVF